MTLTPGLVAVIGQGYVGLPLAVAAANNGYRVVGIDNDSERVRLLNAGQSPVGDISNATLQALLDAGSYSAKDSFAETSGAEIIVLCVPTPYGNEAPDLSFVEHGAKVVGEHMEKGALVILESTTYPGTTEEVLLPLLESSSGLKGGDDFDLAFSPERIDPGNAAYDLHNTPKVVAGLSPRATERAIEFYGHFVETVVRVSSTATAEMVKLLENTFRHINIALVNEIAIVCHDMGIDVWEVINSAETKPFGFMPFYPGPGVGGHCIPVDPMYLLWRVRQLGGSARFIELARDINNAMPIYCVTRIQKLLNAQMKAMKGSRVLVLGVAYKPNVADIRESPAIPLISALIDEGALVEFYDPYVQQIDLPTHGVMKSLTIDQLETSTMDCAVIATPHSNVNYQKLVESGSPIFDIRNHLKRPTPNVTAL